MVLCIKQKPLRGRAGQKAYKPPFLWWHATQVTILWVMNARLGDWESALPPDVAQRLAEVAASNG